MPVTLESRSRRMQVFHLPHEVCCRDRCACADVAVFVVAENPRTGERARKTVVKQVPGSITFLARERKENLPAALLELAQVKTAIGRGYLRIVSQLPDDATPPVATAAAVTPAHVAMAAPGQPAVGPSPAHASATPGQAGPPTEAAPPTSGSAHAPAPPIASAPTPAPSVSAASSPPAPHAPPPATQPPGKEA